MKSTGKDEIFIDKTSAVITYSESNVYKTTRHTLYIPTHKKWLKVISIFNSTRKVIKINRARFILLPFTHTHTPCVYIIKIYERVLVMRAAEST